MLGFDKNASGWDLLSYLYQFLPRQDLFNLALLDHAAKTTVDTPFFWQNLYQQNGLPPTKDDIERATFISAYKHKASPLLKEILFILEHQEAILEAFPRHPQKWIDFFAQFTTWQEDILCFEANLKDVDQTLERFNERLLKLQSPIMPSKNITWHYLSRLKDHWLADLYHQYPQDTNAKFPIKHINFQHCGFATLPDTIKGFQHLETLDLYNTRLQSLPSTLSELPNLSMLLCSGGNFSHFPDVITQCLNLRTLSLPAMNVQELPANIRNLKALEYLYLLDNQLQTLPKELSRLKNLSYLPIQNNPLSLDQPEEVLRVFNKLKMNIHDFARPDNAADQSSDIDTLTQAMSSLYLPSSNTEPSQGELKQNLSPSSRPRPVL